MNTWRIFDTFVDASEGSPVTSFLMDLTMHVRDRKMVIVLKQIPGLNLYSEADGDGVLVLHSL